jgi:hypothetical protein
LSITALCTHGNIAHASDLYFHSYCPVGSGSFAHIDIIFTAIALLAAYLSHPSPHHPSIHHSTELCIPYFNNNGHDGDGYGSYKDSSTSSNQQH